jgi:ABC-2 type transport system ATP-binding protein
LRLISDAREAEATETDHMSGPSLELRGLRRSFGDLVSVADLSFAVPAGRLFGFVGRNGAGKTTTMRIICGLLAADAGSVSWDGRPIDRRVRERIGYMPEERGLYPKMRLGDQLEYLAVLHGASHEQGRAAARSWLDRLGLGDRVGARVEELSHGNQQRVQLAAALVHRPDLLILDEPFAGLDPIAADVMAQALREEAARGVPVILSSHQLELVERICESVAIIDHGRLVASGRVDELRAGGPRLVRVNVRGAAPDWTKSLPGVELVEGSDGRAVFRLEPAGDLEQILDAARRAGSVTHFAEVRPSLAELFREAVSS